MEKSPFIDVFTRERVAGSRQTRESFKWDVVRKGGKMEREAPGADVHRKLAKQRDAAKPEKC